MKNRSSALAVVACSAIAMPAWAETTECTVISSLPATITVPGIYCLKSDLMTSMASGNAITINTNFVTLDLNGWRLGGGAAGAGTSARGIYAPDRRGLTIKNGSIKGFYHGVYLEGSAGTTNVVEGIRADGNTYAAIVVQGSDSIVRNNQVTNTGGSTFDTYGISCSGTGHRILNNDVSAVAATVGTYAYGIYSTGSYVVIAGNRISDIQSTQDWSVGISTASDHVIADNQIVGATGASEYGIRVDGNSVIRNNLISGYLVGVFAGPTSTVYSGNVVVGATTAYTGGTAHGSTNAP